MTSHRIAFYMPDFAGGGVERNIVILSNELMRRNIPCMVVVDDTRGPVRELLHENVEVVELSNRMPILSRVLDLRRTLRQWNATAVFARNGRSPFTAVMANLIGHKWKTILSIHNTMASLRDDNGTAGPERGIALWLRNIPIIGLPLKKRKLWFFMPILGRLAHHTFAVSRPVEQELLEIGIPKRKCSTIYNPIDFQWIKNINADSKESHSDHVSIPEDKPYILSVGRLVPQKAYNNLIKAFALIANDTNANLVIAGEGPEEQDLKDQVKKYDLTERVLFPGFLTNPFPLYENAKMFALASHREGFPTVLMEALAFGLPIVANNGLGGAKDTLDHGKYGNLILDGDIHAFAKAMLEALAREQSKEEKDALVARANEFDVSIIVDQYLALLD